MLILTRKINESVLISGGIRITVVKIESGIVKLGIEAPPDVKILREELNETPDPKKHKGVEGSRKVLSNVPLPPGPKNRPGTKPGASCGREGTGLKCFADLPSPKTKR